MSEGDFVILGQSIPKGGSARLDLDVAKLHTRTPVKIPVIVERAKTDGPVLLLMSGVHGDEVNGVGIIREIIERKYHKPKKGVVICIPVFNVFGYLMQTREFPDGRDLNRVFPGTASGSLASQFAYAFTKEIIPLVDYVIDFHTGGANRSNAPQVRCCFMDKEALNMAKLFGAPYVVNSNYIPKSIRYTLTKLGKKVLLYEAGKSNELNSEVVTYGVNGAYNIMKYMGLHEGELSVQEEPTIIEKSKWIRAPYSGMFSAFVPNGTSIKKKDLMGVIQDPYGLFRKKMYTPFDCEVFCINTSPTVNKGDALFHVSVKI